MSRQTHVYHLVDPLDRVVRYVGMTKHPRTRLRAHIEESREQQNTRKKTWIAGLLAKGLEPVLVVVATYPDEVLGRRAESAEVWRHVDTIYNLHDPAKNAPPLRPEELAEARRISRANRKAGTYNGRKK